MRILSILLIILLIPAAYAQNDFEITNYRWNGLSELYDITKRNYRVEILTIDAIDDLMTQERKIIVIIHPMEKLLPEKLYSYVSSGGRVLIADDFAMGNSALGGFGLSFAGEKVSCGEDSSYYAKACCPEVTEFEPHPVTEGVRRIVSNYPTAIEYYSSKSFKVLARFPNDCFYDLNYNGYWDAGERSAGGAVFLLAYSAGRGRMVVLSDPSIFINEMLSRGDNKRLYKNILNWLSDGDYSYTIILLDRDKDDDGLSDSYEKLFTGTDPEKADTDGDGTADGLEDLDNDGLNNIEESQSGTNPRNPDTDGDGIYDNEDAEPLSKNVGAELLKLLFFNQPLFLAFLALVSALMGRTHKPTIKSFLKKPSLAMSEFTKLVSKTTKSRNYSEPAYYLGREFFGRIQEMVEVPELSGGDNAGIFRKFVEKTLGRDHYSEKLAEILTDNYPDLDRGKVYKLIKRFREIVNSYNSNQRKIRVSEREMKRLYITTKEVLKTMGVDEFERGLRQGKRGV